MTPPTAINGTRRRAECPVHASILTGAADAIDALTARVAQLEACLTDTLQQLEQGGVTE